MTPVCPFCRTPIEGEDVSCCPDCDTPHHLECWMDNNGCSVAGCSQAPADDPRMTLTPADSRSAKAGLQAATLANLGVPDRLQAATPAVVAPRKRAVFRLLGVCLGPLGFHNFYAGHTIRGGAQLALTCLTLYYGALVTWPWALWEVFAVSHDGQRQPMN